MVSFGRTRRREGVSKLNGPPLLVLTSLASGPKHGHALLKDIQTFTGERLGAGTLYGAIARLEERGLIAALPEQDRRRPYRLTPAGAALFREVIAEMDHVIGVGKTRLAFLASPPGPETDAAQGRLG
ncbi:MAG TPA: PadR family transcriptional regulator [Candidatus Binatia bacterium]|nr:PadR family transcriptional regulator [Candidatus Binatia bacterium]